MSRKSDSVPGGSINKRRMARLRRLSTVPRWAVIPTIRTQSVAEHSFHVAWVALWLAERSTPVRSGKVTVEAILRAALIHDESEAVSGDLATPFKQVKSIGGAVEHWERQAQYGAYYLSDDALCILKTADLIEAWLFLHEDRKMGNMAVDSVIQDVTRRFTQVWAEFPWYQKGRPTAEDLLRQFFGSTDIEQHPGLYI